MKTKILILLALSMAMPLASFAHEGHPAAKGDVAAPNGGLIQPADEKYLEVVLLENKLTIYAYDLELKPAAQNTLKLEATTQLPRAAAQPLALTAKGTHWEATFDPKGAHRYTLNLTITHDGHSHTNRFVLEPGAM
jgi:hypothetical protein